LSLKQKERKVAENNHLKNQLREVTSNLKSANDEISNMKSKMEDSKEENKRHQKLFSDEKSSHHNTTKRMGEDIIRLEEQIETQEQLLEVKTKASRKAENSTNRSTINLSTVESSGRVGAKKKRAMGKRQRSHGGTLNGLRSEQKRQETKKAAMAANGN